MLKRIIAGMLSASLVLSAVVTGKLDPLVAEQTQPSAKNSLNNQGCTVEGKNSLGKMIGEAYSEQQNTGITPLSASASELTFEIADVILDRDAGKITVCSTQSLECDILISIIDDDNKDHVIKFSRTVDAGADVTTEIDFVAAELPEFFNVRAVLTDKSGNELSGELFYNEYTHFMQEVRLASVEDFDEDRVINLDAQEDTNFLVLREETVMAESSEYVNTLATADYDNGVYTFENINDTLRNLNEGDLFYIQPNENDIVALSVEKIEISGDTVTLTGNDSEDVFEFVKIEASDNDFGKFQAEEINDDVKYCGTTEEDGDTAYNIKINPTKFYADVSETPSGTDHTFFEKIMNFPHAKTGLELSPIESFDKDFQLNSDEDFKIEGHVSIKFPTIETDYYLKWGDVYVDVKISASAKLSVTGKVEGDLLTLPLLWFYMPTPVFGVTLRFCPKIVVKGEAGFEIACSLSPSMKATYSTDTGLNATSDIWSTSAPLDYSVKLTGEVSLGINLNPGVFFVSDKLATVGAKAEAAIKLSTDMNLLTLHGDLLDSESEENGFSGAIYDALGDDCIHMCADMCIPFDVSITFDVSVGIYSKYIPVINDEALTWKFVSADIPLGSGYYSYFSKEFGWGECPHKAYKVTIEYVGPPEYLKDIKEVQVDNKPISKSPTSDKVWITYCEDKNEHNFGYMLNDGSSYGTFYGVSGFEIDGTPKKLDFSTDSGYSEENIGEAQPTTEFILPEATETPVTTNEKQYARRSIASARIDSGSYSNNNNPHATDEEQAEDQLYYNLHADGFMQISGYGRMANYDYLNNGFHVPNQESIRENTREVAFETTENDYGKDITNIGANFFDGCEKLEKIVLPANLERIEENAFRGCTNLKTITYVGSPNADKESIIDLPPSIKYIGASAFNGCTSLQGELILSDQIEEIGKINSTIGLEPQLFSGYTFANCPGITKIEIPNPSCKMIYTGMFEGCTSLEEIIIPEACENFINHFGGEEKVPESLKKITILQGTDIPGSALGGFTNLDTVVLPADVKTIGENSFYNCSGLKSITYHGSSNSKKNALDLPDTVEIIGRSAFKGCSSLEGKVTLPSALHEIYATAFEGCSSLKSITLSDKTLKIGECYPVLLDTRAFTGATFRGCENLESLIIPEGVEKISGYHIIDTGAEKLNNLYLPKSLTYIDSGTFGSPYNKYFGTVYYSGSEEDWNNITILNNNEAIMRDQNPNLNIVFNYVPESPAVSTVPGDANGDGKVNVADAVAVLQYIANKAKFPLDEQGIINADIDGSPGITGSDAIAIQKIDAGVLVLD